MRVCVYVCVRACVHSFSLHWHFYVDFDCIVLLENITQQ